MTIPPTVSRIYELSFPVETESAHGPVSEGFVLDLAFPHAPFDQSAAIGEGTILSGSDHISLGTHTGTHVDSLLHVTRGPRPLRRHVALAPVASRGVLLDFTRYYGDDLVTRTIPAADVADCAARQGTEIRRGDAVLVRTGRDAIYADASSYLAGPFGGPGVDAARWLADKQVAVVGSDTMPFEAAPSPDPLEVHALLLADNGIQIIEMLDLNDLATDGIHEFFFVLAPLRIVGGTGSPVNPLALV